MTNFVRTYKRRKRFLDELELGSSVSKAAAAAGGNAAQFKRWRETDEDFAKDWDDAIDTGTDFIEDTATDRALTKSDALMAMILKARRPDKYDRGSRLELTGQINVEGSKAKLLNRIARLQAASAKALAAAEEETTEESPEEVGEETPALPSPAETAGDIIGRAKRRRTSRTG